MKHKNPDPHRETMLAELRDILGDYGEPPAVFLAPFRRPLKIGALQDLAARFPGINQQRLKAWFQRWCSSTPYLTRMVKGKNRHDLDGNDHEPISAEHRSYAAGRLKQREKIKAAIRPRKGAPAEKVKAAA